MRIGLLHLAPVAGDIAGNCDRLRHGMEVAARRGARWIITPELATSGYTFHKTRGLDWITQAATEFTVDVARLASSLGVSVFLGAAERDPTSGRLHNSLQVFDRDRGLVASHRKINTLKVGSEEWARPGSSATVVAVGDGERKVGLMVCADACSSRLGADMKALGAEVILSAANWAPGQWGPSGEWEAMSASTELPVFVCNRTGDDAVLSFADAETVVVSGGERELSFQSPVPTLVLVDWDWSASAITSSSYHPLG